MAEHLAPQTVEVEVNAHTKLTEAQARAAWAEEHAKTPKTYTSQTHLLSGILLPIWDRLPGSPHVVRTQTADGERLLGRVVSARDLAKTLMNLGGSNLSSIPMSKVIERIMGGERALLANGWIVQKSRVANENRIEVSGADLGYSRTARDLLVSQGAFVERINWNERVFVPTGDKGEEALARILASKPLVDMLGKGDEGQALFARANPNNPLPVQGKAKDRISDVDMDAVFSRIQTAFAARHKGWLTVEIKRVNSLSDLPPTLQQTAAAQ